MSAPTPGLYSDTVSELVASICNHNEN
jgi:hypothetical protein